MMIVINVGASKRHLEPRPRGETWGRAMLRNYVQSKAQKATHAKAPWLLG